MNDFSNWEIHNAKVVASDEIEFCDNNGGISSSP